MMRQGLRLTPQGSFYARDLSLVRLAPEMTMATWVEDNRREAQVALRSIGSDGKFGPIIRVQPTRGFPAHVQFMPPNHLLWIEFVGLCGRLMWTRADAGEKDVGAPEPVPNLSSINIGAFACCAGSDGTWWLLVESREPQSCLRLLHGMGKTVAEPFVIEKKSPFYARPRLVAGRTTVMAAWDEYHADGYRVCTLDTQQSGSTGQILPAPEHHWETLSALAQSSEGTWFAARCRERLVELEGGVAGHHSELVASVLRADGWKDVAVIDIDHGLNPWMAGYTGMRRFPSLAAGVDNVVLFWEEKEDFDTMDPAPGRFCAATIGSKGLLGRPYIAANNVNYLVTEFGAQANGTWLASKTQTYHHEMHLPWHLHRFKSETEYQPRPTDLVTRCQAPLFRIRGLPQERPVHHEQSSRLFFGDIHLHSRLSPDLDGEQDELFHFARDVARLDFCAFNENDFLHLTEPLSAAMCSQSWRNAEFFNDPGNFTTLAGWEYTKQAEPDQKDPVPNSHRTVLFDGAEGEVFPYWDDGVRTPAPADLCRCFKNQRVLLHHHHQFGLDITDNTLERNIEVCSGWTVAMMMPHYRNALHELLSRGIKLGFFGSSDNHERNPGLGGALIGVWAKENTREHIFDALWHRRIFATTGLRPDLRFSVSGTFMGGTAKIAGAPPFVEVSVAADVPIERIEIVRDGQVVHIVEPDQKKATCQWVDQNCPAGSHFYYAHIQFQGHEHNPRWNIANAYGVNAWTSPIWVNF